MTKRSISSSSLDLMWGDEENAPKITKCESANPLIYVSDGIVHFSAGIDKLSIEIVTREMSKLVEKFYKTHDETDECNVTYVVDTPGGHVNAILKFVDFIDLTKQKYPNVKFTSIISGMVASAGTIMCMVADKRCMTKHAHAMIHELSTGNSGRYTQLMAYTDFLKDLHDKLVDIYHKRTKISKERLEVLLKDDTWYNAVDYLKEGFIDEIK